MQTTSQIKIIRCKFIICHSNISSCRIKKFRHFIRSIILQMIMMTYRSIFNKRSHLLNIFFRNSTYRNISKLFLMCNKNTININNFHFLCCFDKILTFFNECKIHHSFYGRIIRLIYCTL